MRHDKDAADFLDFRYEFQRYVSNESHHFLHRMGAVSLP